MSDQREIIEVEDYRVIDVREVPAEDSAPPPAQSGPPPQFSGKVYTSSGGGGCCLGLSATLLVIGIIFVLGFCVLALAVARFIGWAIPGL